MKHRALWSTAAVLLTGAGAAAWLPGPLEPVAWTPPPVAPPSAATQLNARLRHAERLAQALPGPETLLFDGRGRLLTGLLDGRVVRLTPGEDALEVLTNTGGRPLGLAFHPTEGLIICDAVRGLLALHDDGTLVTLAAEEGGVRFALVDDVAVASDGTIYFTDASTRHSLVQFPEDLFEHRATGRVLAYEPTSRSVRRLAEGLSFANGIALGPGEDFLVFTETGTYRLWRLWLRGPKAGQQELFGDALPGFPDNVRYSAARHVYWVAIGSHRRPELDALAQWPSIRKIIARVPWLLHALVERHSYVLAVDERGVPLESWQDDSADSYSPVASAIDADGFLYIGSFAHGGIARVKLTE